MALVREKYMQECGLGTSIDCHVLQLVLDGVEMTAA